MEIEIKTSTRNTFASLRPGDIFINYETSNYDGYTYVVLSADFGLGIDEDYDGYAADLGSGEIFGFYNSDPVAKLDAKLTATLSVAV